MADSKAPTTEKGHGGVSIVPWSDYADTVEQTPELAWPLSIQMYDLMRRTESQLAGVLRAIFYPIRRYNWYIDPNGADPKKVAVIAEDMGLAVKGEEQTTKPRTKGRFSWDRHLRHALLAGIFGHMFFEQYGEVEETPGFADPIWRLKKLAPRMPATISKIKVARDGGLEGIEQFGTGRPGEPLAPSIPVSQLLAYVNDQEGGNWFGNSWLRAAYKHWLIKDRLLRVDALKHERNGMGVPTVEAMQNASARQMRELDELTAKYKAGEESHGVLPHGAKLRLVGVEGSLPDTLGSIRYHDEQMSKLMLVQFLDLGTTGSGNRALGEAFIDFFDLSLETTAKWIADVTTEHQVEDQWDWNWGEEDTAARIGFDKNPDPRLSIEELKSAVESGLLVVDEEVREWIRDKTGLPRAISTPTPTPTNEPPPPPTPAEIEAARRSRRPFDHRPPEVSAAFDLPTGRTTRRGLYEHEIRAATDFNAMEVVWRDNRDSLLAEWQGVKAAQIDALGVQIEEIALGIADGDNTLSDFADLDLSGIPEVSGENLLTTHLRAMADEAAEYAIAEAAAQKVTIALTTAERTALLDAAGQQATAMNSMLRQSITQTAANKAIQLADLDAIAADPARLAADVKTHLKGLSNQYLEDQFAGGMTAAQNLGRRSVMAKEEGTYYASELLDAATCVNCIGKDGVEYSDETTMLVDYPSGGYRNCLGGPRCRGTPVKVYAEGDASGPEETEPPPTDPEPEPEPDPSEHFPPDKDFRSTRDAEITDDDWAKSLSQDEISAIKNYTSDGHIDMNKWLREHPSAPKGAGGASKWLDSDGMSLDDYENMGNAATRKGAYDALQESISRYPEMAEPRILYRGIEFDGDFSVNSFPEGSLIELHGFQSATTDVSIAARRFSSEYQGAVFEIVTKKGAPVGAVGEFGYHEAETLLAHKSRFRVHAVKDGTFNLHGKEHKRKIIQLIDTDLL